MKIRKATLNDASNISLLVTALAEKYILPTCTPEGGEKLFASMTTDSIAQYLTDGYQYYVAEQDSSVIGVIGMKNNTEIYHLFVSESHQGQGISRKLWECAKSVCLSNGNKGFFTVCSALNAKDVYLKMGFSQTQGIKDNAGIQEIPMQMFC